MYYTYFIIILTLITIHILYRVNISCVYNACIVASSIRILFRSLRYTYTHVVLLFIILYTRNMKTDALRHHGRTQLNSRGVASARALTPFRYNII